MTDHPARARVAEIVVARVGGGGEERTRGSGYLVSPGWVLTACHVVADAESVGVWLGAPPELVPEAGLAIDVGRVLAVPAADLALLPLGGPGDGRLGEPALFGRLDRDPGPPVPVTAAGCPRFKLRPAPAPRDVLLRELDFAMGSIAALSDAKTGRFAFAVDTPPGPDPEPGKHSPWEGMSGAAVWASGRLIGVVGQHHPREGPGTLTVCPVEQLFDSASDDQLEAWRTALPQLPATAAGLWPATPPTIRKSEVARARRAMEALAPRVLIGRAAELAALEEFTAAGARWRWIQAEAFAGKTALMAWFALHPPERVDVAACFLRRASGDDTAEYALDVLTRQLAVLADRRGYLPAQFASQLSNDFADLLEDAARACAERDRQLMVLLDGLDEYDPATASLDLADWLPGDRTLPDQVMLLAASRAGADVRLAPGHPLHSSVHRITASEAATEIQHAARAELDRAVRAPGGFLRPLLSCLAVAGSGLTASELRALLKRRGRDADVSEIEAELASSLGRSLTRLPNPDGTGTAVHAFAHETLLTEARSQFASDLATYEALLDTWADEYAIQDWPSDTPQYLLAPYTRELARRARDLARPDARRGNVISGALDRLSALARSPSRHAFLLAATGTDYAALTEISTAQNLIADQGVSGLQAAVELAVYRHAILIRNESIPLHLLIVWARLGHFDHAEALARAITDDDNRAWTLSQLVAAIAQAGEFERAEALARTIDWPGSQVEALAGLAAALAQAGHADRAYRLAEEAGALARTIEELDNEVGALEALAGLVTSLARAGDFDHAHALARSIDEPDFQVEAFAGLVTSLAKAGDFDRAEAIAASITDPYDRASALTGLVSAIAHAGDQVRADRLADAARACAAAITDPGFQTKALAGLITALARAGDHGRAGQLAADAEYEARTITQSYTQAEALSGLVTALAQGGDFDRAEALARTIADPYIPAQLLAGLATSIAQAGDFDRAEALARTITEPFNQAQALGGLAATLAQAGHRDRADLLAEESVALDRTVTDPGAQARGLARLVTVFAQAGDTGRSQTLARTIANAEIKAQSLAGLAIMLVQAGDNDQAYRMAEEAEAVARTVTNPQAKARALAALAAALGRVGDRDRAYELVTAAVAVARTITSPDIQAQELGGLVTTLTDAGDFERAEALARTVADPDRQAEALGGLVTALAQARDFDRAEALARTIADPDRQAQALGGLVTALADAGHFDRGEALARTIAHPYFQTTAVSDLAIAFAQAGHHDRALRLAADAEALAVRIPEPFYQARALSGVAIALAQGGNRDRAHQVAEDADARARALAEPIQQIDALGGLVTAFARTGDLGYAEALARSISGPYYQVDPLVALVALIATAGDPDHAQAITATISDPGTQAQALASLATVAAQAGDPNRAEALARKLDGQDNQAEVLAGLAAAFAHAGDHDRAFRLAKEAEALARTITLPETQARVLGMAATVIAPSGDADHAGRLLARALMTDPTEIWWTNVVSDLFPLVIRGARDVFAEAYAVRA